ncbi:MAG: NAD-dependent epimerase/dehydratase family protein [Desulfarculaceae bacterium]|nr:NAD-dependent epimerase/dehydratase family protein [Desulfarculaceae bacterium]MCF8070743.1 NAD-dependent epimerase/dehydratase family protein [Desulfarculaceae bacterium]MCF8102180.1 NAD-dependent epimerase/dehydratase family protein [Desulfarculaceae bacterium]MCF8117021.1 NAD-dependent epimerase/dehydratase family protein [Desulfarculaceae bacterium]
MAMVITGGTGFIGSQLARFAVDGGLRPLLLDPAPPGPDMAGLLPAIEYQPSSLNSLSSLLEILRGRQVDTIVHLGGMLSVPSEEDPWAAIEVNINGTFRLLEAARLSGVKRLVMASSIAVYGQDLPQGPVDETAVEHPGSMYGVGKVSCELMGRLYQRRFGLDFRALRLPSVVGPGSKVPHMSIYNCWAIERPLQCKPYALLVEPQTRCPVIYYRDAARALWELSQAPEEDIKTRVYNVAGTRSTFSAQELVDQVKAMVPEAELSFAPDPDISRMMSQVARLELDDSRAREEWGWQAGYDLESMVRQFRDDFRAANPDNE